MLTDTRIRNARPRKTPYKLTDGAGLYVEIRPNGVKLWRYRYRIAARENLYALGEYAKAPEAETHKEGDARRAGGRFTLTEARAERERCRGLVKQSIHPAHQRDLEALQRQHADANTFYAVAREWVEQNAQHWTTRVKTQRERLLEREVFPTIGSLPIDKVTPAHILAILDRIKKKRPRAAILARQAIGATFDHAVATLRAAANPTVSLRKSIKAPPTKHKTPLEAKQIPGFFKALDGYTGSFQTKAALRLVWWTLTRTNETLQAKWTELDLDGATWEIPGERMKKRTVRPHVIPLPSQAVDLLRGLHAFTGESKYVFPNRSSNRRPAAVTLLNKAVSSMGYAGKFSPHAIRTTGSTALNEMGFNGDWIERQLAHSDRNETRSSYNGAKYLDQRREMMQSWADYLDALCAGRKVIPFKQGKAAA